MKEQLFIKLYDSYHQDVFKFLMYLVRDREVVEDLTQEVYIRALKSYERFNHTSSEKTWLFAIAKNVSIDYFRKQKVRSRHAFDHFDWEKERFITNEPSPEQQVLVSEQMQQLLNALEQCSGDQKMVIVLRFIQQLSVSETAAILEFSEAKVKTTQHRAIAKLKDVMKSRTEEGIVNE